MADQPYTPAEEQMRDLYVSRWGQRDRGLAVEQFDRFIKGVKRDAAREALDGLADHSDARDGDGVRGRLGGIIRTWRDARYPEETP